MTPWRTQATRSRPIPVSTQGFRSEEHTSELQSQSNLVCRLLLEKKKSDWRDHLCGAGRHSGGLVQCLLHRQGMQDQYHHSFMRTDGVPCDCGFSLSACLLALSM